VDQCIASAANLALPVLPANVPLYIRKHQIAAQNIILTFPPSIEDKYPFNGPTLTEISQKPSEALPASKYSAKTAKLDKLHTGMTIESDSEPRIELKSQVEIGE